jgi:predicted TIM-barrel fold metal-dependent hydrolase
LFVAAEAEDRLLVHELAVIGDDHIVCSSDIPHSEKRENSATKIIERSDLSEQQKRKILYENSVLLFGPP